MACVYGDCEGCPAAMGCPGYGYDYGDDAEAK